MSKELKHLAELENPGYHRVEIPKGELGEISKIYEEVLEALDAEDQSSSVMVLVELADLIGAVKAYLARHHSSISLEDLETFASITRRAFASGRRS